MTVSLTAFILNDHFRGPQHVDLTAGGVLVCDIDGTIADISRRRPFIEARPKDWARFHAGMEADIPIWETILFVQLAHKAGWTVVMCTGRDQSHEDVTRDWLARHDVPFHHLMMREKGDRRADTTVKRELLRMMGIMGLKPTLVIEDRARVVAMWRAEGLDCVQVAEGDF